MKLLSRVVGPFRENSYLVVDDASGHAVLIDPGDEGDTIITMVEESGATLDAVWLTHAHLDHIGAISAVRRRYGDIPVYLHRDDWPVYEVAADYARTYEVPFEQPEPANRELVHGDALHVGNLSFTVMHAAGHSPGHVVFYGNGILIGGDVLFAGSIGRTDLPMADPAQMQLTLAMLAELPGDTIVYPGHSVPTTIGAELASNPFLNGLANVKRNTN